MWRMLRAHVEAARSQVDWSEVVWVGADEMNRRKGHNYVTVFADPLNKRVLFGTEGKDASVWESFAQELQAHNGHPKAITQAAIDMSPAYIKGGRKNFGNAELVFDKFHEYPALM
jgi:transposase